ADDRRTWIKRFFAWRRAGQRPSREFLRERGASFGGRHAGADRGCARARAAGLRGNPGKRGGGLERVKPIQRNASAAAADQESYRPDLVTDEEPKYLRRQKPVEIRRKKLGGKTWPFYRRVFVWTVTGAALVTAGYFGSRYALYSPQMLLVRPDQIDVSGNHIIAREEIQKLFVHDRN